MSNAMMQLSKFSVPSYYLKAVKPAGSFHVVKTLIHLLDNHVLYEYLRKLDFCYSSESFPVIIHLSLAIG